MSYDSQYLSTLHRAQLLHTQKVDTVSTDFRRSSLVEVGKHLNREVRFYYIQLRCMLKI